MKNNSLRAVCQEGNQIDIRPHPWANSFGANNGKERRFVLLTKGAGESIAGGDGLDVLRRGLKQKASRVPNFDFAYVDAVLTILRTALEIKNYYAAALLKHVDLTPARMSLLMTLFLSEGQVVLASELGELLVVTPGNVTGLVDGLVSDRLVRRVTYPGDRRAVLVELTEEGRRFIRWFAPIHFQLIRSLLSGLSRAQARSLAKLLDAVRERIRSVPPPTITRRPVPTRGQFHKSADQRANAHLSKPRIGRGV